MVGKAIRRRYALACAAARVLDGGGPAAAKHEARPEVHDSGMVANRQSAVARSTAPGSRMTRLTGGKHAQPWPGPDRDFLGTGCGAGAESADAPPVTARSVALNVAPRSEVDVLFMIDNSNSMDSMQTYLRDNFYEFFRPFDDLAAKGIYTDFHIGVVTSDLGAGATGAPGCTSFGAGSGDGES